MIVTLIGAVSSWLSTFFKWGVIVIDWLQRGDFLNTKLIDLLRWLFSPTGAYFFGGLCLTTFLIATYRTVHAKERPEQLADALPGSKQKQLEEESYVRRKVADDVPLPRESAKSISAPTQLQPAPNFVCAVIDHLPAHEEYGILVEGHADGYSDAFVYGVKISNEFDPARKVGKISDVSAQIFYTSADGQTLKVLRGTWLSESRYQVEFDVNHEHSLIIAGIPRFITQGAQPVFYFRREASDSDQGIKDRINGLGGDSYQVKIRLINESEGVVHEEPPYKLTIIREPIFRIELTEDKQQTAPPQAQEAITRTAESEPHKLSFEIERLEVSALVGRNEINVCGNIQFDNPTAQTLTVKELSLALRDRSPEREVARARLILFGKKGTSAQHDMTRGVPVEGGRLSEFYSFHFVMPLHGATVEMLDAKQFLRFTMKAQQQRPFDKDEAVDWVTARKNRKCGNITLG
jgi:hypothetical protein